MYGAGIARGLWITLRHFVNTYVQDIRRGSKEFIGQNEFERRQGMKTEGIYTVQYPDEKIAVPERFRFVPFLVVEDADHPERPGHDWCTSCGICAKVCPPQCIWIVRGQDPVSGRPVPEPEAFFIDIDICMNCGFCAEFCPFDAIKMDHDYEMAAYDRTSRHIHDKQKLSKPFSYWKSIAPTTAYEEMVERGGWEHSDVLKERKKAEKAAAKAPPPAATPTAPAVEAGVAPAAEAVAETSPALASDDDAEAKAKAERLRKREEALARKRAKEQGGE